jgi:DNA-binding IscR family transcriptional regulator
VGREPIPEELRRFILTSVRSVPFVEALLVFRAAQGAPVHAQTVSQRLYIGEGAASDLVGELRDAGIVAPVASQRGAYCYAPASPELAAMLDMLAIFYSTHLVDVTQLVHSVSARRAMQFADAFKLRKDS